MPFDSTLADRIRKSLGRRRGLTERRMFGGLAFQWQGHIVTGVWRESLIVRVGAAAYPDLLREPFVRDFDITGKPLTGWLLVSPAGIEDESSLKLWLNRAWRFARTLPAKPPTPVSRKQ